MLQLNFRQYGDHADPPIVLLHGLFGSSSNWGSIAKYLAERYFVLVPDLRNHGQSPHDPDVSYQAMVDDLLGLFDAQGIDAATLVGHSMGGKVSMHLALNYPQRVNALAVVDMSPVSYSHDFDNILAGFDAVDVHAVKNRSEADAQMATQIPERGIRAFLLQNLVKQADGWGWRLNLASLAARQAEITDFPDQPDGVSYEGPSSFIYGELSGYVKPAYEQAIRRYFPNAVLCPVAGAGHWVYAEQPEGFRRCLEAFLAG